VDAPSPGHDEARERLHVGARDVAIGALAASALVHAALAPQHSDEPLLATAFAAAAVVSAPVAYGLTRPDFRYGRALAGLLFASLLVAYPVVHFVNGEPVQRLDVLTKAVEVVGLLAVLRSDPDDEPSLAPGAVIAGVFLGFLVLGLGGGAEHHHAVTRR
jgi:hypothetical protein